MNERLKGVLGIVLIIGGIGLGIYVGLYRCFIGGIVDLVNQFKSPETIEGIKLAWAIAKIVFASAIGSIVGGIPVAIGKALLQD